MVCLTIVTLISITTFRPHTEGHHHRLMKTCNLRSKRRDQYRETNDKSGTLYTHYPRWLISFMTRPKKKSVLEEIFGKYFFPKYFSKPFTPRRISKKTVASNT